MVDALFFSNIIMYGRLCRSRQKKVIICWMKLSMIVETNLPPSPGPRGYLHEFDLRADHVHKAVGSSWNGIESRIVWQPYSKIIRVNWPFVKCLVFLMLMVFPTLFQFPAICISYITRISVISVIRISNRVISCPVLNVLCSEHFIKKPLEVTCK